MQMPKLKDAVKDKFPVNIDKAFDNLFVSVPSGDEKIVYIPCLKLIIDENQPFKLYSEEQLMDLAERIKRSGLLNPIIVRPAETDNFEVLSGRNRAKAVMLNGDNEIKAIIRDVDDDVAALIMLDANLGQREDLLPSEKAKAYKMEADILYRRGKRPDSSLGNDCPNFDARQAIGERHNESKRTITNYIRLTNLIPELLNFVDEKKLSLVCGVELSYLSVEEQQILLDEYISNGVKLSKEQILALKALSKEYNLNSQTMANILAAPPKKEVIPKTIKLNRDRFNDFTDIIDTVENLEELFLQFLNEYRKKHA